MSQLKNIHKILLSFLVIVNLSLCFDYIGERESHTNDYHIALILAQNHYENDSVDFDLFKPSFSLCKPILSDKKIHNLDCQINIQNLLDELKFHTQEYTVLNFKSILLQIVLNDISNQNSHHI